MYHAAWYLRMRMCMISDMRMHIYMHVGMRMACGRMRHEHGMHSCARHAHGMLLSRMYHAAWYLRMRMRMISDMRMHIYMHVGMRMACGRMRHEHGMHSCARHAHGMLLSLSTHAYACNHALAYNTMHAIPFPDRMAAKAAVNHVHANTC